MKVESLGAYRYAVTADIKNVGERDGDEVVQLYINDLESSVATPDRLLRGFKRLSIAAGETKEVRLEIGYDDLKLLGLDWKWKVEPGDFDIMLGASSVDIRLKETITVK